MNSSPELRELHSNDAILRQIADRTRGRVLKPFDTAGAEIFTREGLAVTASPLPVWDIMIPILLALILADVATRRIAWDWEATKRWAGVAAEHVRGFTQATTLRRGGEGAASMDALKRVRSEVAEQKFKPADGPAAAAPQPDRSAKFEAKGGVEGDITKVVGGATDKPVPPPPKKIEPKGGPATAAGPGAHMGGLMEAKRRAQQKIKEKEQGEGQ